MKKSRVSQIQKLRTNNKTTFDVLEEKNAKKMRLLNFKSGDRVEIIWDINKQAIEDGMFIMKVGDKEVILNAEEVRRAIRWV